MNRRLSLINAMIGGAAAYLTPWDGEQLMTGWYVKIILAILVFVHPQRRADMFTSAIHRFCTAKVL